MTDYYQILTTAVLTRVFFYATGIPGAFTSVVHEREQAGPVDVFVLEQHAAAAAAANAGQLPCTAPTPGMAARLQDGKLRLSLEHPAPVCQDAKQATCQEEDHAFHFQVGSARCR